MNPDDRSGPNPTPPEASALPPPIPPEQAGPTAQPGAAPKLANDVVATVQGSWENAWRLLRSDPAALLLGGIITALLSGLSFGIVAGALSWGFYTMCFQRMRFEQPMRVETVFSKFERFGTSFAVMLLTVVAVAVGTMLLVVPGLYAAIVFLYALPIALDEKVDAIEAMKRSRKRVHEEGFWPHAALLGSLLLVGGIISRLFMGVLSIVWYPFAMAIVASAYEKYVRLNPATAR